MRYRRPRRGWCIPSLSPAQTPLTLFVRFQYAADPTKFIYFAFYFVLSKRTSLLSLPPSPSSVPRINTPTPNPHPI